MIASAICVAKLEVEVEVVPRRLGYTQSMSGMHKIEGKRK